MSLFTEIEKIIERGFRHWTERVLGPGQADDLILVHRAILEEIQGKVETLGRGRRLFPYARVTVTLVSPDAGRREVLRSAFGELLAESVRESLQVAGCELPKGFGVEVRTAEAGETPFRIDYATEAHAAPETRPTARLIVTKGKAEQPEYALETARVNIGRLAELTDADERMTRRNHVVFEEGADAANGTVSRKHAHIRLEGGDYRLCDDGSEFGTRVFREGRSIEVPTGNRRGEKLRPGDEIYLGRACLRFEQ